MYRCRKVQCPYCSHIFMWMNGDSIQNKIYEYRVEGIDTQIEDTSCPNCGRLCLILPDILIGIREDDPRVEKFGIRGL